MNCWRRTLWARCPYVTYWTAKCWRVHISFRYCWL